MAVSVKANTYEVAVHEAGHALVVCLCPEFMTIAQVTIIPNYSQGYNGLTSYYSKLHLCELNSEAYLSGVLNHIFALVAGRVAEDMIGHKSYGWSDDYLQAYKLVEKFSSSACPNTALRNQCFAKYNLDLGYSWTDFIPRRTIPLSRKAGQPYKTAQDKIIDQCYQYVKKLLHQHRDKLFRLADELYRKQTLSSYEVHEILNF